MPAFLSPPVETLWRLRRLAVLLALLPWLVWLPPVLFSEASPTIVILPQGMEAGLLIGWLPLMLALLLLFPAAHWEHVALAVVVGVAALLLPVLTALLEPYRPLSDRQMIGVIGGACLFGLLMLLAWSFLALVLHQLSFLPLRFLFRSTGKARSSLSPRAAFLGLRHAPMQANRLRMTGTPDHEGWFPVWVRHAWEGRLGDSLLAEHRADFIGPIAPQYWARIRSEDGGTQVIDQRPHDPDLRQHVGLYRLQVQPRGAATLVIEHERSLHMPLLMMLSFWLCDFGSSSLRARLDYLEGHARTRAPHLRAGSPLRIIAALMDPLSAPR